jgi:hypothetical protein
MFSSLMRRTAGRVGGADEHRNKAGSGTREIHNAMHPLDDGRSYGIEVDGAGRATISIHLLMEFL